MAVRFQLRRDTAANWANTNPILALGEPGVETDTLRVKIGDGNTAWNSLGYSITKDFADLTNTPTTLAGYGVTDALTLNALSVTQTDGDGGSDLTYNNTTGVFTFTASSPPASPAFHGFVVNSNGDLEYTRMTSGDLLVANGDATEQYVMWEIGTNDYSWKIADDGMLQLQYADSEI